MSTQNYYKEKLGFDPRDSIYNDAPPQKYRKAEQDVPQGYEENLTKFKGTIWDLFIQATSDERDAVQKKTFTKWVNKHLKKHWRYMKTYTCLHVCVYINNSPCCPPARRNIRDLFEDLRDGHNLISLLEVLTGEQLPREKGQMRFHMLHNIDTALHFLRCKNVKLVNIRSEDIVDGNPKLTLGLIWTIILHFQISDIVVGQEPNVSAKDYLLRWAKRTTHKYPGVNVQDFTKSWRDGLAFSSIIHRNRPDLIDWGRARVQRPRERLETVFFVAEKEYGVTRLLDPEDVDTHEPDEKSLITYISSLHEVFPEPPPIHPLYDSVAQQRKQEYREIASSLHNWMREKYSLMQDRNFPPTLIEMKKLAAESTRFRTDEVPPRQRDKQYCHQLFRDLEKYFKTVGEVDIEPELHIDNIERNWQRLMNAYQERDRHILEEIKRLEKLQRLAEKVHREIKQTDSHLDQIEQAIELESRRIERLHPLEAKKVADQIDHDLVVAEQAIQSLKTDVNTLRNGRYPQAGELDKRVNKLHEKWVRLRHQLHNKIVGPLANMSFPVEERTVTKHIRTVQETRNIETNPHFRSLQEHIEWCKNKLKQLKTADFGTDLPSIQQERDIHQREHKTIEQFHSKVEQTVKARQYFSGEELTLYNQHLGQLQKVYAELLSFSTGRANDLESLYDFIQSATRELQWLNEKEEIEVTRDWSDAKLDVEAVEKYYEHLMSDLEKRELQFNSVLERGEALVLQNHPATKAIEAHLAAMNAQWAWLLQLTHCLETHLQNTKVYQQFFKDVSTAEEWLREKDEVMNNEFSQGEFSLDVGERLLQGMQALKEELNAFGDQVQALIGRAQHVVPLKQRRQPITRPLTVTAICNYKKNDFVIERKKECTLTDNSGRTKWRVFNTKGVECQVPGVCFVLPPPDKDALDAVDRLQRQYDRSLALWQKKQLRMRQNMIFATIKVVKGWDLPQFIAIGAEQRNAIRKALNEDADKLIAEGDPSDPQLRRLRREMDEVNRLFDEFEKRARAEEESKNQTKIFNNQIHNLQRALDEAERIINQRVLSPLPRDLDSLQHLIFEHKEFESRLQNLEPEIEQVKETFRSITLKTPQHKKDLEKVLDKWNYIWNTSNLYIERLKCMEIVLNGMEDAQQVISEFESKLSSLKELPNTEKGLKAVHDDLLKLESAVGQQQIAMDQLNDDFDNAKRLTEKSRPNQRGPHADVERLDKDIQRLNSRWASVCQQLADRLKGCQQAYDLLQKYNQAKQVEDDWMDEQYKKLETMQPIKDRAKEALDATRNQLNNVVERTPKIEQVNLNGGRFIREGKIWSKGVQKSRDALLDAHPSLDASDVFKNKESGPAGADIVAKDLDEFNDRYRYLIDVLYGRLQEIAKMNPNDIVTLRLVEQMQPQPFRTFRTEFHMSSASEQTSTFTTTTHYQKQYIKTTRTENGTTNIKISDKQTRYTDEPDRIANGRPPDKHTTRTQIIQEGSQNWGTSMQFTEIKSLKRVHKVHEGIGTESITDIAGIINPYTGEQMTVRDAILERILDVRSGMIIASPDGTQITIEDAKKRGLIDGKVAEKLQSPCGIKEDGRELTLLEAIQKDILEAEQGFVDPSEKRLKVIHSTTINQAIDDGKVDVSSGTYKLDSGKTIDIKEAYKRGYLLQHTEVKLQTEALALSDVINQGLIDDVTGWIIDRNTGNKYQIDAATKCNIVDGDVREIADPKLDTKITVIQAIDKGIINAKLGKYVLGHEKITFLEAKRRQFVVKPKTLKEIVDDNLMDLDGKILSPLHHSKLTLLEAANRGVLDIDQIKCILDFRTNELITLNDALREGIILPDSKFRNSVTGEIMSIQEAVGRGFIISVVKKSIFDVDGFQPPDKSDQISFNAAIAKGFISKKQNGSLLVDKKSGKLIRFDEGVQSGEVKLEVYEMLSRGVGIYENQKELNVLEAVFKGLIDPKTGNLIDPKSGKVIYLKDAIDQHFITPEGAATLNSLLNLNVSTRLTRTLVQRYVAVTTKDVKQEIITYTEALRLGLIDNEQQTFKDPITHRIIPIVQAISEGRLAPDVESSEKVISPRQPSSTVITIVSKKETPIVHSEKSKIKELPNEGWNLADAIAQKHFDPVTGLFTIPGTDRLASFEECVSLKLISSDSAVIVDPVTKRKLSISKALEKKILDSTGHYVVNNQKLTIQEAINQGFILFEDDSMEVDSVIETGNKNFIQIQPGVIYDQSSNSLTFSDKNKTSSLAEAIHRNQIPSDSIKITDPYTGRSLDLKEAIRRNIIDPQKGEITDKSGQKITLKDAAKMGILTVVGAPVAALRTITNLFITNPKTGEKVPAEEALKEGLIDLATYEKLKAELEETPGNFVKTITKTVLKITDPKTGESYTGEEALKRGLVTSQQLEEFEKQQNISKELQISTITITNPKTGEKISAEEALKEGLIDLATYEKLQSELEESPSKFVKTITQTILKITDPKTGQTYTSEEALKLGLVTPEQLDLQISKDVKIIDPKTCKSFTSHEALQQGLITPQQLEEVQTGKPHLSQTKIKLMGTAAISLDENEGPSEGQKTRARITTEPTYRVKIGRAQSLSPDREAKKVVLQKLRRKIVKPEDAANTGLIESDAASLLADKSNFISEEGEKLTLQEAIESNKLEGGKGVIVDPQRGDHLTINEAISRGILDPDGFNEILVPLNRSLSIPEVIKQGLLDPITQKVVHPETGAHLSISEAIVCDIVDPLSTLVEKSGDKVTLEAALESGIVDDEKSLVETNSGAKNLEQAVKEQVFDEISPVGPLTLPPAGMTLPIAIKRGLVDSTTKEIVHPITKETIPISEAIKDNFIMSLPFPIAPEAVRVEDALESKLIDTESGTYKDPKSGELYPISEAVEKGLLIVKQPTSVISFSSSAPVTAVTETVNTVHTVTTKTIELLSGYSLLSSGEVQNIETGQIIPMEEAKMQGIVREGKEKKTKTVIKDIHMSFAEALNKGLVDMNSGTFTDPKSGESISIQQAIIEGKILATPQTSIETVTTETSSKSTELNISEAFESIYDEKTEKFIDVHNRNEITFKEALEKEIIDPNSMIYDVTAQKAITVEQAVEKGLIDSSTGKIKDETTGKSIDFKEAAKKGLIAVLGGLAAPVVAPIAAGVLAVNAVKEYADKKKQEKHKVVIEKLKPLTVEISMSPEQQTSTVQIIKKEETFSSPTIVQILPIGDAISQNAIEPKICRILYNNSELPYTIQDGLDQGKINLLDEVQVISNQKVILADVHKSAVITISKHMTAQQLAELGYYDLRRRLFMDPQSGVHITFEDLVYELGVIDPDTVLVKDLTKKPFTYVTLHEAFEKPLVDRQTGFMVDPKTGKKVPFFEAVKLRWIIHVDDKPKEKHKPLTLQEIAATDKFDPVKVEVVTDKENIPLIRALTLNEVDPKSVTIKDPKNMQLVPYYEAVDKQIVDPQRGLIVNTATQKTMKFSEAFLQGWVLAIPRPISLQAVINKGMYDTESAKIKDPLTKQLLTVNDAISRQIIDDKISEIKDTKEDNFVILEEAVGKKLINEGKVVDTKTGQLASLDKALQLQLIRTKPVVFNLLQVILANYYSPHTGRILNPITGDEITLAKAIEFKLVDPATTRIKDDRRGRIVEVHEAIENRLIDAEKGLLTSPPLTLDQAYLKGYILSTVLPWSLQETLAQNVYDTNSGLIIFNNSTVTISQAIEGGIINPSVLTVKDPKSGDIITLNEAIQTKLIDPIKGQAYDPITNSEINLIEAQERGLIVPYKTQITLPEAVFKGFYDPSTGKFINPKNKERLKASSAINRGYVDTSGTLVTIDEEIVTFDQAVSEGLIDTSEGVVVRYNEPLDFNEAFERGLLVEVRPPIALSEAIAKGIYDEESQLFLDPQTGEYLTLIEAIEISLIDAESVSVKDTRVGIWRKISLIDAIHNNYVDGNTGKVRDFSKGESCEVSLQRAFDLGILVDNKAAISLQRAIHQGLYDENTGKVLDHSTDRKVTLHEAIRNFNINPHLPCYFDRKQGKLYDLAETCRLAIIDKRSGTFKENGELIKLTEALNRGLIVDIESANFGLAEALDMGLFVVDEGVFVHPATGRKYNLKEAVENELINPIASLVKNSKLNKYMQLPAALENKLIDDNLGKYVFPHNKTIDLVEARNKGLIVTACTPLTLEEAILNSLYRPESGKLVDPVNNEFYDLKQALTIKFIDPQTTAYKDPLSDIAKPLLQAIQQGNIDVDKGRVYDPTSRKIFNFEEAFKKGLLVTLSKPLEEEFVEQSVRDSASRQLRECTLQDAIKFELLNPDLAVIRDLQNGKFKTVNEAVKDGQLVLTKTVIFDVQVGKVKSLIVTYDQSLVVYLKEPLSFRQAIESGLLNIETGKFIVPQLEEELTLKDSIALGFIDPDSVLIKDSNKKKLIKLPEGFRKGLIEAEKGNVLDTATSKLYSLVHALDSGLLITPNTGFTLIETITYGIYNPTTGCFTDPFVVTNIIDRRKLTLAEAIEGNLVEPSTTVVKDLESGAIVPLLHGIEISVVDAQAGRLHDNVEKKEYDFAKALEKGLILPAEQRFEGPRELIIFMCLPVFDFVHSKWHFDGPHCTPCNVDWLNPSYITCFQFSYIEHSIVMARLTVFVPINAVFRFYFKYLFCTDLIPVKYFLGRDLTV
ncbi:plectin isoform X36 [Euwallacea similis]|uniref:plectin isoform X36 n=1 Tax=Euwallacea similis TaxID=1736056 RepID=UPI00344CDA0E